MTVQEYHYISNYNIKERKIQANHQMRLNIEMDQQYSWDTGEESQLNIYDLDDDDTGYKNEVVELTDDQLLINIQKIQSQNNIKQSQNLVKDLGKIGRASCRERVLVNAVGATIKKEVD